ncbi:MAG: 50S ribosomal protein L24e [Candidatus Ranarchaeia archaeon]
MPRIEFCTFCGHEIAPGKGLDFIKNDATIYHFCSNKCKVNLLKLKRKPRKFKWTAKYEAKTS